MISDLVHVYMVWGWFLLAGALPSIYFYVKGVRNA